MTAEDVDAEAALAVPHAHRAVGPAGDRAAPVRRHRQRQDLPDVLARAVGVNLTGAAAELRVAVERLDLREAAVLAQVSAVVAQGVRAAVLAPACAVLEQPQGAGIEEPGGSDVNGRSRAPAGG